jgi:colicin import membrane protein
MIFFKTTHERKSLILTSIIILLVIFLCSFIGLKYFEPPVEYGVEVSFMDYPSNKKAEVFETNESVSDKIEKQKISSPKSNLKLDKLITQDDDSEMTSIKKNNKSSENKLENKINESTEKTVKSFLSNLSKNKRTEENENILDNETNKFNDIYSSTYYTKKNATEDKNQYGLNGRNLRSSGLVSHKCNEEGIVVVKILVDPSGNVISADPGVKGSTNIDNCLLDPAKKTALTFKWFPDKNAPDKQVGFVVIQFKLSE